jgi:hypothetical protein
MAALLSTCHPGSGTPTNRQGVVEPLFLEARDDVKRVLEILEQVGTASAPEMQKTRTEVLRAAFESIQW